MYRLRSTENLAEPLIDGICVDCVRKKAGIGPRKNRPLAPKKPALVKGDPLANSVMEALGIDDAPRQVMAEPAPAKVVPFRPREYPALRTISRIYRIAAVLVGVFFGIAEVIVIVGFVAA